MNKCSIPDFQSLFTAFNWKPIFGCPGRYVLKERKQYSIKELAGDAAAVRTFTLKEVLDKVCIVVLRDGGIISYEKGNGSFVHTLNNESGFLRKLEKLGVKEHVACDPVQPSVE